MYIQIYNSITGSRTLTMIQEDDKMLKEKYRVVKDYILYHYNNGEFYSLVIKVSEDEQGEYFEFFYDQLGTKVYTTISGTLRLDRFWRIYSLIRNDKNINPYEDYTEVEPRYESSKDPNSTGNPPLNIENFSKTGDPLPYQFNQHTTDAPVDGVMKISDATIQDSSAIKIAPEEINNIDINETLRLKEEINVAEESEAAAIQIENELGEMVNNTLKLNPDALQKQLDFLNTVNKKHKAK